MPRSFCGIAQAGACALHLSNFAGRKMATSNPLEEILSSAVDENAINALVGSLESQLASPVPKQLIQQVSNPPTTPNHVTTGIISNASSTHAVDHKPPVLVSGSTNLGTINTQNGPKQGVPGIPISSIRQTGSVTFHNVQNANTKPNVSVITNATPTVTLQSVKSESPIPRNVPVSNLQVNVNGQNIAAGTDQKPLIRPMSGQLGGPLKVSNTATLTGPRSLTVREQLDNSKQGAGGVHVMNSGASDTKQLVIKTEPGLAVKTQIKQEPRHTRSPVLNIVKTSANTPVSTSVITITKPMTNPQTVTVVKPSGAVPQTGLQPGTQIVVSNTPARASISQSQPQKSLAPRVVNQPIRIAAGQVKLYSYTIHLLNYSVK